MNMEMGVWILLLIWCLGVQGTFAFELEKPQYAVVHEESDFEVRLYREMTWMSASPVQEVSFEKVTRQGFHRLFQFIQGANLNFSRIPMTAPVLTSIVPGAGPFESSGYIVRFYLPTKFQDSPPTPLPELKLYPDHWDSHCVAVRKFSGFAKDENIVKEAASLATSLSKSPWADISFDRGENYAYSIAQYNSPFKIFGRLNEVWVNITGSVSDQCQPLLTLLKSAS
uniref:SOUL heme-binding protein n=1 Tax=Araucaria cunninghamii TaxID=56994 RepID=A0A0D6R8E8_ARACU